MPNQPIKAVFFDLGDTLLNFGKVDVKSVFKQASHDSYDYLLSTGQKPPKFKLYALINYIAIQYKSILAALTGNDFDSLELLKKVGSRYHLTPEQWDQLSEKWYIPLKKYCSTEPDLPQTLQTLKDMNLKLAIISNTFVTASTLNNHLKEVNIFEYFDEIVYSYQLPWRKPNPRIFKHMAEQFNLKTENIMYVGDRIDKDIIPSIKLNITPVLKKAYTNHGKTPPQGTINIEKISQLPEIIKNINNN